MKTNAHPVDKRSGQYSLFGKLDFLFIVPQHIQLFILSYIQFCNISYIKYPVVRTCCWKSVKVHLVAKINEVC
jgi:hypothetical protein